jgi:hypothetical protein
VIRAGKAVTVLAGDDTFRLVIDGETVAVASRAASSEIHRYKAYATLPRKAVTRCPELRLNASDAAKLAELVQFLSGWLARDPGRLASRLRRQPRPTAPRSCGRTWTVSFSCSAATAGNCSAGTAIMPTARPSSHEDSPLRSRRPARGYRFPPGTAFCAVRAVIQQSAGIRSSDCSGTGVPGAGRGQASYLLSASTRRSMSSSTLPDLGSCRPASWSLSSALVRPS